MRGTGGLSSRGLSHAEAAAVLSKVLGRTITYVDVPSGAAAQSMRVTHGHYARTV